jgi:hypothetical protein
LQQKKEKEKETALVNKHLHLRRNNLMMHRSTASAPDLLNQKHAHHPTSTTKRSPRGRAAVKLATKEMNKNIEDNTNGSLKIFPQGKNSHQPSTTNNQKRREAPKSLESMIVADFFGTEEPGEEPKTTVKNPLVGEKSRTSAFSNLPIKKLGRSSSFSTSPKVPFMASRSSLSGHSTSNTKQSLESLVISALLEYSIAHQHGSEDEAEGTRKGDRSSRKKVGNREFFFFC